MYAYTIYYEYSIIGVNIVRYEEASCEPWHDSVARLAH